MIEIASVKPGTETPIGDGLQNAHRCILLTGKERRERSGVVKRMELQKVLAEAFSAVLLRLWGLTVPQPFLVTDGDALAFASADDGYPSLKQRLRYSDRLPHEVQAALLAAASVLSADFEQTPLALTCDEAIDNRDRNIGNILWDGTTAAWIDHELALGLGHHMADVNKLATMAIHAGKHETVQASSIAAWMTISRNAPNNASDEFSTHQDTIEDFAEFVSMRLGGLGSRITARFPQPKDLLSAL